MITSEELNGIINKNAEQVQKTVSDLIVSGDAQFTAAGLFRGCLLITYGLVRIAEAIEKVSK